MAVRIPISSLTPEQQSQIRKDLLIEENRPVHQKAYGTKKKICFYRVDQQTQEVILPYYYASVFLKFPIPNQIKVYPKVPPFQVKCPPRDYQVEVITSSIYNFMKRGTTFLNVFCSYGKTYIAAYFSAMFSQAYGLATLVTYPRTIIGRSWLGTFQSKTNAKVYLIDSNNSEPDPDTQVFLCMDTRLKKISPEILKRIGHLVLDEADCFCTSGHIDGILSFEPMFITSLTATYERDDGFHKMLDYLVGPERIIRISMKPFFIFKIPTCYRPNSRVGANGIIFDSLIEELDQIEERNEIIVNLVLSNLDQKILILTKHINHAKLLHEILTLRLQPYNKQVSLLIGGTRNYKDSNLLITTFSKAGRGFDEENGCLDWGGQRIGMGILASSTKKIEQPIGRFLRTELPVIFDIVDDHYILKQHWRIRYKWYESRNGIVNTMFPGAKFSWSEHREKFLSGVGISAQFPPEAITVECSFFSTSVSTIVPDSASDSEGSSSK